jgi:SAM-dependent methyltransferase
MSPTNGCPVCKSTRTQVRWRSLRDRLFRTTDERFDVAHCRDCRTVFLADIPPLERLQRYYPDDYWMGPTDRDDRQRAQGGLLEAYRRFVLRDHVRFVGSVVHGQRLRGEPVRVLDVGCGDGSFLEALGERGACGMDLSLPALRAVRARGFTAVRGTLTDCPLTPGSFSLVTAFHFLEHVHPVEPVLAALRALLAPGGEVVLQVPNARSLQAQLLGRFWAGYDVPRHLVDYSARTLCGVLERCGFAVVATNHHCLRDNPTTVANSLVPRLYPPARMSRPGGSRGLGGALANLAYLGVTLLSTPFCVVESLCGRGASVMVHARPR